MNTDHIMAILKEEIASAINQTPDAIDENLSFVKLGLSSIQALKVINRIQKKLDIDFNPIAMFEYKTLALFVDYLAECVREREAMS